MSILSEKIMKDIELFRGIDVQTLIINIKILSRLDVADRPVFSDKYIIISKYNWFSPIIRYITGQSRQNILNGLTQLYNNIELIITNKDVSNENKIDIKIEIDNMLRNGLKNLSITYESDAVCASLIEFIMMRLSKLITS